MKAKPTHSDHHLNQLDLDRVTTGNPTSQISSMLCNDQDCFIDGSELDATLRNYSPENVSGAADQQIPISKSR